MVNYELLKRINKNNRFKDVSSDEISELIVKNSEAAEYFKAELDTLNERMKIDDDSKILSGSFNGFGTKLNHEAIQAYLSYVNLPCFENWKNFRSFVLIGHKTAWQIWTENDLEAPKSDLDPFNQFPDPENFDRYFKNSLINQRKRLTLKYLLSSWGSFSLQYKGFKIQPNFLNYFDLVDDENNMVLKRKSYSEIIEYIKEQYEECKILFVIDFGLTFSVYEREKITELFEE